MVEFLGITEDRRIVAVDARHQTVTFTYRDYSSPASSFQIAGGKSRKTLREKRLILGVSLQLFWRVSLV